MVYITGDTHGDYTRFSTDRFSAQKEMSYQDTMIILGDFGLWHDSPEERYWLDWLNDKPFTTVWIDGNYENFNRLYSNEFAECDFHGGRAHQIRPHIFHLKRGYIYEVDGKSFFAFGGAKSHDIEDGILYREDFESEKEFRKTIKKYYEGGKLFRIAHETWWEQELPSYEEIEFGEKMLADHGGEVDYVITHCGPQSVVSFMGYHGWDLETMFLEEVAHNNLFTHWFFGHYHRDEDIFGKFHCRYERIERII